MHFPSTFSRRCERCSNHSRGSQCLFSSWRLISVRVLIATRAIETGPRSAKGAARVFQIFKTPACYFRVNVYKQCDSCQRTISCSFRVLRCEAEMSFRTFIVTLTVMYLVQCVAPARFPVSMNELMNELSNCKYH